MRIGTDIVNIARMGQALARRPRLAERLFTAEERRYCESKRDSAQHFAVRFAAKEAVAKALGKSLRWWDVEITRAAGMAPQAILRGRAKKVAAGGRIEISLSHSGEYAIACALYDPPAGLGTRGETENRGKLRDT